MIAARAALWDGEPTRIGSGAPSILRLATPLTLFFLAQSGLGLVTLAVAGRLGEAVLAGVGAASVLVALLQALLFGVDAAVQAMIARRVGEGRPDAVGPVLADALAVAAPLGLGLSLAAACAGPALIASGLRDARAAAAAADFLRAVAPQLLLLALTIPVNAAWIAQGRPGRALLVTAVTAPLQLLATLVLTLGAGLVPSLGAAGAGWAASAAALGAVPVQLALLARPGAAPGLAGARPTRQGAWTVVSLGWAISLQQAAAQLGFLLGVWIVSQTGIAAVAAANVLVGLATAPAQLSVGVGVAGGVLAGQALGRGDVRAARSWGWRAGGLATLICAPFVLLGLFATRPVLGLFLHDPATLTLAIWPARLMALGVLADNGARALCFCLRGAGATRIGAAVPFAAQWVATLPLGAWLALASGLGLLGFCIAQAAAAWAEVAITASLWLGHLWPNARVRSPKRTS